MQGAQCCWFLLDSKRPRVSSRDTCGWPVAVGFPGRRMQSRSLAGSWRRTQTHVPRTSPLRTSTSSITGQVGRRLVRTLLPGPIGRPSGSGLEVHGYLQPSLTRTVARWDELLAASTSGRRQGFRTLASNRIGSFDPCSVSSVSRLQRPTVCGLLAPKPIRKISKLLVLGTRDWQNKDSYLPNNPSPTYPFTRGSLAYRLPGVSLVTSQRRDNHTSALSLSCCSISHR